MAKAQHRMPDARRRDPSRVDPRVGTRVGAFVEGADLRRVADALAATREEILRRWFEATRLQPFHAGQPDGAVANHIPHLFDALVAFLQRARPRDEQATAPLDDQAVREFATEHAQDRFRQGLGAADVLTEFRLLRQEIGRVLRTHPATQGATADVLGAELLVHDALDGATTLALGALDTLEAERRHLAAEVVRLAAERERTLEAARFLSGAGEVLGRSLDLDETLASVARLAVPRVADWCQVYLVGEGGAIRRVAGTHADPSKQPLFDRLMAFPLSPDPGHPVRRAVTARETFDTAVAPPGDVDRYGTNPEHAQLLREMGTTWATVVPMVARGETVGVLTFGRAGDRSVDHELAEELARRAALAIDNARLYRQAREALLARDELLGAVAHDLKTPLTAIKGNADLLHHSAAAGRAAPARVAQRTAAISLAAGAMAAQIGELLDLVRLRAGHPLDLVRRPVDLVALAYRVAAQVQAGAGGHTIDVDAAVPELVGQWDGFRLERVLGNLLSNAVKYSPGGGRVAVGIRREEQEGRAVASLTVVDGGIGIPAGDLPRVFERYYRAANVVGRLPGEGIGLAGAKQIVEQHGGTTAVQSEEGHGSTFTVRLPLDGAA